jgi:hypothetical protein
MRTLRSINALSTVPLSVDPDFVSGSHVDYVLNMLSVQHAHTMQGQNVVVVVTHQEKLRSPVPPTSTPPPLRCRLARELLLRPPVAPASNRLPALAWLPVSQWLRPPEIAPNASVTSLKGEEQMSADWGVAEVVPKATSPEMDLAMGGALASAAGLPEGLGSCHEAPAEDSKRSSIPRGVTNSSEACFVRGGRTSGTGTVGSSGIGSGVQGRGGDTGGFSRRGDMERGPATSTGDKLGAWQRGDILCGPVNMTGDKPGA